ncbi:hypothetical protein ACRPOS_000175 [Bartonella heixiaziensis]|uniref:hypothetical protein n=1 Tax=Bartonella heixiaziensis TaxID=1461000 RepID=UPI003908AEC4
MSVGNGSETRQIIGVAAGSGDTDAVNKGQLDENVTTLSKNIEDVRSVAVLYDEEEDTEEGSTLTRSARKVNKKSVTFGNLSQGQVGLHKVAAGKITENAHDVCEVFWWWSWL